jgi:O-antigen/teichoic acid export membrane protein
MKSNSSSKQVSRGVISLFSSNIIAFLITGLSYFVYSKSLLPSEFGLYSIALAIASFGTLALDGGLKNTIIKSPNNLSKDEEGTLLFLMVSSSLFLVIMMILLGQPLGHYFPDINRDYRFLALFGGIYLLSYPWMVISTAALERKFEYMKIAWVESIGMVLEKGIAALLILYINTGIYSFIWGLLIGRLFRITLINSFYKSSFCIPSWTKFKAILYLLAEGSWLQSATAASLIRDNLHIILVGVMFGKAWVGYYSWGLQLCSISSQAFVQISARISIPMFAQAKNFDESWRVCQYQIKLLTLLTGPILVVMLIAVPSINENLLNGKWSAAIGLLPLLIARMFPGLAITPVGAMLMVDKGGRTFAIANITWTVLEFVIGGIFILLIGPTGLAWSYALVVWLGIWIFLFYMSEITNKLVYEVGKSLFKGSSIYVAIFLTILVYLYCNSLGINLINIYNATLFSIGIILISYLSEKEFRNKLGIKL